MTIHNIGGGSKPSANIIYVDPEMALRVLAKNTRNRPISELHVQRLMGEMLSGRWQYNGEAIKWSVDDVLLDGQHRLTALSRLHKDFPAIPFLVVRGLPTGVQDTMDQGRVRSAGDQLSIDGLVGANGKDFAAAIRVYIQWTSGGLFGEKTKTAVTNPQVVDWAKTHTVEMSIMENIWREPMRRVKCRRALVLAVLLHFRLVDGEAARDFEAGLLTGAGLDEGNPILTLRERLDRIKTQGVKTPDRDYIAFFVLAWNAWRQGRKMAKFQRPVGGSWSAESFPKAI